MEIEKNELIGSILEVVSTQRLSFGFCCCVRRHGNDEADRGKYAQCRHKKKGSFDGTTNHILISYSNFNKYSTTALWCVVLFRFAAIFLVSSRAYLCICNAMANNNRLVIPRDATIAIRHSDANFPHVGRCQKLPQATALNLCSSLQFSVHFLEILSTLRAM